MAARAQRSAGARFAPLLAPSDDVPAPIFITQRRKVREFIADQQRIATIKSDWLYSFCGEEGRRKLLAYT